MDLRDALDQFYAGQSGPAEKGIVGTGNFRKKVISDSLAVHPAQIPEAIDEAKRRGVSAEFLPDGRMVFNNSSDFRKYAKAHGFRHRGY